MMNKKIIYLAIFILLVGLSFIIFSPTSPRFTGNQIISIEKLPTETTNSQTPTTIYEIKINNFEFVPDSLTISKGDKVIWTNEESFEHTITSDKGYELESPLLSKNEEYSHTFKTSGEYSYHCIIHNWMRGKIIVLE